MFQFGVNVMFGVASLLCPSRFFEKFEQFAHDLCLSKVNFKLVSQFKKVSILCPLITSALLYVVKALHGRCPYHCIVQKIHKSSGALL